LYVVIDDNKCTTPGWNCDEHSGIHSGKFGKIAMKFEIIATRNLI
jgi:hypothetical protein